MLFVLDVVGYIFLVDLIVFCIAIVGEIIVGGQWEVVEEIMFVAGVLLFGYATLSLWPTSIEDEPNTRLDDYTAVGRVQRTVDALPMLTSGSSMRLPENVKLFLASIVVVITAFLIERLFVI